MAAESISGFVRSFFLYDLCEEIDLAKVRALVDSSVYGRQSGFRHLAPEYVRFERPPVVERIDSVVLDGGTRLLCTVSYYDYGIISVAFEVPFAFDWTGLVSLCASSSNAPEIEKKAAEVAHQCESKVREALVKPYDHHLAEDYYIAHVQPVAGPEGTLSGSSLIERFGSEIAQIVRGETVPLSDEERGEVLSSRLSYYPNDLLIVGWSGALIYDTSESALPTIQLLEYANSQLLEFRHYDDLLSDLLSQVYDAVSSGSGLLGRWRLAREAARLNAIQLDVRELTERVDNSIKFLSDTFSSRVYRLAAHRVGVPDYRTLVDQKLSTAGELYRFMMDRFYQGRAFALEAMVVVILMIELVYLFRGRT